jgi:drug/metabolite transporter (DMT)-like permease
MRENSACVSPTCIHRKLYVIMQFAKVCVLPKSILDQFCAVVYCGTAQRGRRYIDPIRYVWMVEVSATIGILIMYLVLENQLTNYPPQTWAIFFATAIVSQIIGYLVITYALGHLPASIVSPTLIGKPVLTTTLAVPLFGETPMHIQWFGGAIANPSINIVN